MKIPRLVALALCVSSLTACKVKVGNGSFDGSFFDDAGVDSATADAAKGGDDAGGEGDDSGALDAGSGSAPKLADVPAALAKAECAALRKCLAPALLSDYLNGKDCVASRTQAKADSDLAFLSAAVAAKRVVWKPALLAACLSDITALGCDVDRSRLPASCKEALHGKTALDGDCDTDLDCLGAAICDKGTQATCPGHCLALQTVGLPCAADAECKSGLVCHASVCTAPGVDGSTCETSVDPDCVAGFVCRGATQSRVCRSIDKVYTGDEAAACDALQTLCKPELVCASTTGTMGMCSKTVGKDASCVRATPNQCPDTQYCNATTAGALGACVDYPKDGEACLSTRSQKCAAGYACITTAQTALCKPMRKVGEGCGDKDECYSGICADSGQGAVCVTEKACSL